MAESPLTQMQPIERFSKFFRAYNFGLSLVIATIPIVISSWDVLPIFKNDKTQLTFLASVASYLCVGFIFQQRVGIAKLYFPHGSKAKSSYSEDVKRSIWYSRLPLLLAVLSIIFFHVYYLLNTAAVQQVAYSHSSLIGSDELTDGPCEALLRLGGVQQRARVKLSAYEVTTETIVRCKYQETDAKTRFVRESEIEIPSQKLIIQILEQTPAPAVPYRTAMMVLFVLGFIFATSAFVLMGLREYLLEILGIRDEDLINNRLNAAEIKKFDIPEIPGAYGKVEFSLGDSSLPPKVEGFFCVAHNLIPTAAATDEGGKITKWVHTVQDGKETKYYTCHLKAEFTISEIQAMLENSSHVTVAKYRKLRSINGDGPQSETDA